MTDEEGPGRDTLRCPEPSDIQALEATLVDGRYEIDRTIDRGAFGVLYLARDVFLERMVCLKVIAPEHVSRPEVVARFRREAALLAAVRSEHVARVFASGPCGQSLYLAMEYVEGRNLQQIVDDHSAHHQLVTAARALTIMRRVAEGLAAVHDAGIVHRDVKPGNVMIEDQTGRPVLVDFGLALTADPVAVEDTETIGTPQYMAPEQIAPGTYGPVVPATDVYALACTAYELFTGRPPFDDPTPYRVLEMQISAIPQPPSAHRADLAPLDAVLLKALAKRPADRHTDAHELVRALELVRLEPRKSVPPPRLIEDNPSHTIVHANLPLRIETPIDEPTTLKFRDPTQPLRMLVISPDDEVRMVAARAAQIALFGQKVRTKHVRGGFAAIDDADQKRPDLIVLDCLLPDLDAPETLARLRDYAGVTSARVVVVAGHEGTELWMYRAYGIDGIVRRPIELEEMVATLAELARRARWTDASTRDLSPIV
ncbi:MAG: protein kinase [Deltaproteobacteria bacterium]|nr:protein kinase [Deltaproteobacteria bacterium]